MTLVLHETLSTAHAGMKSASFYGRYAHCGTLDDIALSALLLIFRKNSPVKRMNKKNCHPPHVELVLDIALLLCRNKSIALLSFHSSSPFSVALHFPVPSLHLPPSSLSFTFRLTPYIFHPSFCSIRSIDVVCIVDSI